MSISPNIHSQARKKIFHGNGNKKKSAISILISENDYKTKSLIKAKEGSSIIKILMGFPGDAVIKNPPANARYVKNMGMILGMGLSLRVRNGNPLQCSCLEIPLTE